MANPVGRPAKYNSPEEMQRLIDEYFNDCPDKIGETPAPTITGLALHLGFVNRASMYDYESKPEYTNTIKLAKAKMERVYELILAYGKSPTGAIFALKNFGWTDKCELEEEEREVTPAMIEEFEAKLLR